MPTPADLSPTRVELPEPEIHEAEVLDDAEGPADEVRCVGGFLGDQYATERLQWPPFVKPAGLFYPKNGDRALVSYHADGPPAIVAWWPSAPDPDHAF